MPQKSVLICVNPWLEKECLLVNLGQECWGIIIILLVFTNPVAIFMVKFCDPAPRLSVEVYEGPFG